MLDNKEIAAILDQRIERARQGGITDEYRRNAINYYLNRARGDETAGRSQVQDSSVADMIHAILAQLAPAFAGDSICEFESEGPQDDMQARLETLTVNKVISERNRGYVSIQEAIHDALLMRVGIIKGWVEETEDSETREYDSASLSPEQRASLSRSAPGMETEVEEDGESLRVTKTRTRRRLRTQSVDPLNFWVEAGHDSVLLEDCRGVYERREMTRGELLEAGFDRAKIDELNLLAPNTTSNQRNPGAMGTNADTQSGWAGELVEIYDCHVRLDVDGDDKAELKRFIYGSKTLLLEEEATYIPYAAGVAIIWPHQFLGLSMYDRQKPIQDIRTGILRQTLDSFAASNLCRMGVDIERIIDNTDLEDGRTNGYVRTRGNPLEVIQPIPNQDISAQAVGLLQYTEGMRADKGGAALQMASGEAQLVGQQMGSMGADRILSVQEQLSGYFARNLAETLIRSTFLLVHRLLRTEMSEPITVSLAGQQVQVNPMLWPTRDRINIKAGLSPGERNRKAMTLMQVIQQQATLAQAGLDGVLCDAQGYYSAVMDWAAASDVDNPGKYFIDPQSQRSQAAGQQKGQQGQMQQQLQQQIAQIPLMIEKMRTDMDRYKADLDAKVKLQIEALHAEVEEAKIIGTATADLQLAEFNARTAAVGNGPEGGIQEAA